MKRGRVAAGSGKARLQEATWRHDRSTTKSNDAAVPPSRSTVAADLMLKRCIMHRNDRWSEVISRTFRQEVSFTEDYGSGQGQIDAMPFQRSRVRRIHETVRSDVQGSGVERWVPGNALQMGRRSKTRDVYAV